MERISTILDEYGSPLRTTSSGRQSIRATYDTAATTPENSNHWSHADALSPNQSVTPDVRRMLRIRSRYEIANNSYVKGMIQTKTNWIVGTGPSLQMIGEDGDGNQLIESAWHDWCCETRFCEKTGIAVTSYQGDGEGFGVYANANELDGPVKVTIRLLEADQIADKWEDSFSSFDREQRRVDGITLHRNGEPKAYHVLDRHPGSGGTYTEWNPNSGRWLSAKQVLHLFREDRPGQRRGIPHLTPSLPLFAILRRHTLAVLGSAENAANIGLFMRTDATVTAQEVQDMDAFLNVPFVRNMLMSLPFGWDISQLRAEQPTDRYVEFHRQVLNEASRCLEMPFNIAAANSSDYNYASGRLDHQMFWKAIQIEQRKIEERWVEPTFRLWLRLYLSSQSGIAPSEIDLTNYNHIWTWDAVQHVDPLKEAQAQQILWNLGHVTDQEVFYKSNRKPHQVYDQLRQSVAIRKELGLPIPGVAAQTVMVEDETESSDVA